MDNIYIYTHTLVGGFKHVLFFHILGGVFPTDFHIFQGGPNHQPDLAVFSEKVTVSAAKGLTH